jgi:ABC-2 type transport system ATP-binding protein
VTTAVTAAAIEVDGLTKRYGERTVVDGVSLQVHPGELVALLGPNGAGKSTTVEAIEGYRRADGGTVRVLGADPSTAGREHRARIGLMLQSGGFDIRARPLETIRQYAAFHADPLEPATLLSTVGLETAARTPYKRLSGGERQRLGLAVALVGRPDVLVLDEPTAGMDPEARAATRSLLHEQRANGAAILLTSHELADVERLADRIVILVEGRVRASGTVAELTAGLRPRLRFTLDRPLDAAALADVGTAIGATAIELEPGRYEIAGAEPTPALLAAVSGWCATNGRLVTESRSVGGTLEEAYLDIVQGSGGAETTA